MKIVTLTAEQKAEATMLQAAVTSAQTALKTAKKALNVFLVIAVSVTPQQKATLTSDGSTVVIQP